MSKVFPDTNILVYSLDQADAAKNVIFCGRKISTMGRLSAGFAPKTR
jgi:hypothetical protein